MEVTFAAPAGWPPASDGSEFYERITKFTIRTRRAQALNSVVSQYTARLDEFSARLGVLVAMPPSTACGHLEHLGCSLVVCGPICLDSTLTQHRALASMPPGGLEHSFPQLVPNSPGSGEALRISSRLSGASFLVRGIDAGDFGKQRRERPFGAMVIRSKLRPRPSLTGSTTSAGRINH